MKPQKTKELNRHVDVVLKALDILDALDGSAGRTILELMEHTQLTRGRVTRLIGTLQSKGFVAVDESGRRYRLGLRLLSLGRSVEQNLELIGLARPVMRWLVEKTGELASLYVIDGLERVALAREDAKHVIRYSLKEGQRMEIYAGAAGKVLLAFATEELQRRVINEKFLKQLTKNTITDVELMHAQLADIRRRGYAISYGEREEEAASIAAPIRDHQGQVCASLGIAGPLNRFRDSMQGDYLTSLLKAAERLNSCLGYEPQTNQKEG